MSCPSNPLKNNTLIKSTNEKIFKAQYFFFNFSFFKQKSTFFTSNKGECIYLLKSKIASQFFKWIHFYSYFYIWVKKLKIFKLNSQKLIFKNI